MKIIHNGIMWLVDYEVDKPNGQLKEAWLDDGNGNYVELSAIDQEVAAAVIEAIKDEITTSQCLNRFKL